MKTACAFVVVVATFAAASRSYSADVLRFHPASAMVHIGGVDGVFPEAASEYSLTMVRGERQGFQFALDSAAGEEAVTAVTIKTPGAKAPAATLYRVLAVNHTTPRADKDFHVPPRRLGPIPDVLMPLKDRPVNAKALPFKAGEAPLTYYVEFETARESEPALYEYTITVESAGGASSLAVHVTVENVTIPVRLSFRTATDWEWSLQDYYGRDLKPEEKEVFWNFCLDQRLSPCSFFGREPDPAPAALAKLKDRGLNVVCLMGPRRQDERVRRFNDKEIKNYTSVLAQWRTELKALGLEKDAVALIADEPKPEDADAARANGAWLKTQFPELKLWAGTRPAAPWDQFIDLFDPITIHSTDYYVPHSHDEILLRRWLQVRPYPASEYWWFQSVEPYAPYTNVRLDNLPIEARVTGWQSAQAKVDGYEYFWITGWDENKDSADVPWPERASKWNTGLSGAGTLCYPDEKKCPMPSLRLVNLRDGIQDWELLEMLCPRHATMQTAPGLNAVTKSLSEYTTDPAVLLNSRKQVIEALLKKENK